VNFDPCFRAVDELDTRSRRHGGGKSHQRRLAKLIQQRSDYLKGALKPERIQAYRVNQVGAVDARGGGADHGAPPVFGPLNQSGDRRGNKIGFATDAIDWGRARRAIKRNA